MYTSLVFLMMMLSLSSIFLVRLFDNFPEIPIEPI